MKRCILFVNGAYRREYLDFYRQLCRRKFMVAVDGGYNFFRKADIFPDLLIGDFDSLKHIPTNLPATTKVIQFPTDKDKTDLHLAIDYCLQQGAEDFEIVTPEYGEVDHFLGNIFLLIEQLIKKRKAKKLKLRLINHAYEARLVKDSSTAFNNCKWDVLSILPLSSSIRLSCSGTAYTANDLKINYGDSHSLRNLITSQRAVVRIKGAAMVIRLLKKKTIL